MDDIKLLAYDLDGTALVQHKSLSPGNRQALVKAAEKGVFLVPATGRIYSFMPKDILALPGTDYVITSNGSRVVQQSSGKILHHATIPHSLALEVQKILKCYDIYIEYYVNGTAVTLRGNPEKAKGDKEFPASKHHFLSKDYHFVENFDHYLMDPHICPEKINLPYLPSGVRSELFGKLKEIPGLKLTSSIPDNLEINSELATKGQALAALASILEISPENCMAIGDNGNDLDMLRFAGISVAMENASQEAKQASKYLTGSCEQDGLAEAIYRFLG